MQSHLHFHNTLSVYQICLLDFRSGGALKIRYDFRKCLATLWYLKKHDGSMICVKKGVENLLSEARREK